MPNQSSSSWDSHTPYGDNSREKQVDILISKNQALHLLYHAYKRNPRKIDSHGNINSYITIINANIPYNWPTFLAASCLNYGSMSSYALIRVCY